MILSAVISIFATRIILNSLGVSDFGLFNLIVGSISLFTILNGALGTTTQRFLSHSLGKEDNLYLRKIFSNSLLIHIIIAIIIIILLYFSGKFLIYSYLNIPIDKKLVAMQIFYILIVNTFFSIITTPFDGSLVANENFLIIAITEIMLSLLQLISAIYLSVIEHDKLIIYAFVFSIGSIVIALFKQIYCSFKYKECSLIPRYFDRVQFKNILSFAGWNLFGSLCSVARGQGMAVTMNFYFGVIANAAFGIANQISSQVNTLSSVVTKAIYPQLMKSEGKGDRAEMLRYSDLTTQLPFLLILLLGVPVFIEMKYILGIWLKIVPEFTIILSRLSLLLVLVSSLSFGLIAAVQSIGKIKIYQIVVGSLLIIVLPVSIFLFQLKLSLYWGVIVSILFELIAHFFRLFYLRKHTGISVLKYIKTVDLKLFIIFLTVLFCSYIVSFIVDESFLRLVLVFCVSTFVLVLTTFFVLFSVDNQLYIKKYLFYRK